MLYGQDLINSLEEDIKRLQATIDSRFERVNNGETDWDDCFVSQRCEERGISTAQRKIDLIKNGGCAWFVEYATLDGQVVDARWCKTKYGYSLRAKLPNGQVVWTTANTKKGLEKHGLKKVECLRPAWFKFDCGGQKGMLGVYTGNYVLFPSSVNYATGEEAADDPVEIHDFDGKYYGGSSNGSEERRPNA